MTTAQRWGMRLDPASRTLRLAWIAAVRRLEARRAVGDSDHHDHGGGKVGNGVAHFDRIIGRVVGRIGALSI